MKTEAANWKKPVPGLMIIPGSRTDGPGESCLGQPPDLPGFGASASIFLLAYNAEITALLHRPAPAALRCLRATVPKVGSHFKRFLGPERVTRPR